MGSTPPAAPNTKFQSYDLEEDWMQTEPQMYVRNYLSVKVCFFNSSMAALDELHLSWKVGKQHQAAFFFKKSIKSKDIVHFTNVLTVK